MNNKPHSELAKKRMSEAQKRIGTVPPSQKGKRWKRSPAAIEKTRLARLGMKHSQETKDKLSQIGKTKIGALASNWKGGITPKNVKLRGTVEMKLWRKAVFERDGFVCQKYGTLGGKLEAHHVNNFSDYPKLRFVIDNGITLSIEAHKEFHELYGRKNNTREQLQEFLTK